MQHQLTGSIAAGYGYTGIVVASLGALTAGGVLLVGLLLGDIAVGAQNASLVLQIPQQMGDIVTAVLLLTVVSSLTLRNYRIVWRRPSMSISWLAVLTAMFTIATPLAYGALGAILGERTGVLNLGIEGTMYAGAFGGFLAAEKSGSLWLGVVAAIAVGAAAGALMGLLTVTIGVNQHVAGIGVTLGLVAACDYTSRLLYGTGVQARSPKFGRLFEDVDILAQYPPTYFVFLVIAPLLWWVLRSTGAGMRLRAVGENPEAADVAGISVAATRYVALVCGGVLMALGGSFLTLATLGSFTIDIVSGRGWVCIALVIFGRWGVWPTIAGALLFGVTDALQLQLAITPEFGDVPNELMIAVPYLVVIAALVIWGRGIRYPGAYLRPYRRV